MVHALSSQRHEVLSQGLLDHHQEWMACDWQALCAQLLQQWNLLTPKDLMAIGPSRTHIAALVSRKYGVNAVLVENYLSNLERTLPLM